MYERARQFYEIIEQTPNLTEREICERAGLKKTPYSRRILLDLIDAGYVARTQDANADKLTYLYFLQQTERAL